jgi:FtsP/CotA-like multicopper oxidase with cupredoxin domain
VDPQIHRRRADRRLAVVVLAALLALAAGDGAAPSRAQTPVAGRPADPCAAVDALYAGGGGETPFRPLPVLVPSGGVLGLSIDAVRPRAGPLADGVMIGDLRVRGVPLFETAPQGGSQAVIADPRTGALVPMPAACLGSAAWTYGGARWALQQGDHLKVRFSSRLDFDRGEMIPPIAGGVSCRGANLHVHGLMVSPSKRMQPDGRPLYGDYVLDVAAPGGGSGDPCAPGAADHAAMADMPGMGAEDAMDYDIRLPGAPGQSRHDPGGHPSGVFWFHPHPHGYAGLLTTGGTTGVISVGAVADYACVRAPSGGCAPDAVPVRDLLLKDAQVAPDHDGWRLLYDRDYDLEDACAGGKGGDRHGQCSDWKGRRWLFTVNGVRYPVIGDMKPGRAEVWRIVNASPNITYRLRLRPVAGGAPLPFQVLSLEGAGADARGWAGPGSAREVLLMPAARAEIAIAPPPAGGAYVLEQEGFATGGDVWPAVALAEVRFAAGSGPAPPLQLHGPAAAPDAPQRFYASPSAPGCGFEDGEVRRIYFVKRPSFADERRRKDTFGLLAAVQKPGGPPMMADASGHSAELDARAWQALLHGDAHAPAFGHNPFDGVCTFLGHTETWVLENDTDEAHNFHIHQSEFQLALDRRADPAFFSAPPGRTVDPLLTASDQAIDAADGLGREADEAALFHDTIPVPRGVSLGGRGCDGSPLNPRCRPGRVTIRIRFDRDEQVGTFLYHCHILQHEDDGMMALVHVLCPPGDAGCAARTGTGQPPLTSAHGG